MEASCYFELLLRKHYKLPQTKNFQGHTTNAFAGAPPGAPCGDGCSTYGCLHPPEASEVGSNVQPWVAARSATTITRREL